MRIEVATPADRSTKDKGDLLEDLAQEFLQTQSYNVARQVRKVGSELDLLCRHKVNDRRIYVECKAQRDPLSANVLKNLLGTITFEAYEEGWLISAGPLGKDAKGFMVDWESKQPETRRTLSIYTPERVLESLIHARVVIAPPSTSLLGNEPHVSVGGWTLLITEYGRFWVQTVLISGVPRAVRVFSSGSGSPIADVDLLRNLASTDSSLSTLEFEYHTNKEPPSSKRDDSTVQKVVQVQHGENWSDYRPSRPKDFVGRKPAQDNILRFLEGVRAGRVASRVFAVTGDSGMGKSSLIAKLRDRSQNVRNRGKFFLYAVDVRAATRSAYILSSLLACLRAAASSHFIEVDELRLAITDHSEPLASDSIKAALDLAASQKKVICLVFDQFEELYSKPELFPVFEEAQRLFLSAVSASTSLVLGFAWRTDSTVQQDHPAYFMWHRLADHRFEVPVGRFAHAEASNAITIFEHELGHSLLPAIRRQIIESSQGYPWLLKKLCIHLHDRLRLGGNQARLVESLDVRTLFEGDLKALTAAESSCVKLIATQAPADWHEVLETNGPEVLRALQNRRLIVRSGDRINLYWDLFREYVLTKKAPSIPFTYVPSAPSVGAFLDVAEHLGGDNGASFDELAEAVGLASTTVQNVCHDLVMFGIAAASDARVHRSSDLADSSRSTILQAVRSVLKRHALFLHLNSVDEGALLTTDDLLKALLAISPTAHHRSETWKLYAERMANWLCAAGLLEVRPSGWIVSDQGEPVWPATRRGRGGWGRPHRKLFQGEAPPHRVVECLDWVRESIGRTRAEVNTAGYRNALGVLVRFGLAERDQFGTFRPVDPGSNASSIQLVWDQCSSDPTIAEVSNWISDAPRISTDELGERLANQASETWSQGSRRRIASGCRRWAQWLLAGTGGGETPPPTVQGKKGKRDQQDSADQARLFRDD